MKEFEANSGAAIADPANQADNKADHFAHLNLAVLVASLTNPRKSFRADKLTEMADSIRASGVHQPILVRPLPGSRVEETSREKHRGQQWQGYVVPTHEIVSGERRYRASQQAGQTTIPALIRPLTDDQVLEIQIIENLQRDDLTALEEAEGYEALMQHNQISADAVGGKIGKSRSYVYARLKLLDLATECKQALREGKIDASRALLIARIPDSKLQIKALGFATTACVGADAPSLRQFQSWLRTNVMLDLAKAPFDIKLASLNPPAGACTSCAKRTGANPDLFSDVQGADLCTDLPCYQGKAQAAKDLARADFHKQGIKIIEGDEAAELHNYDDRFQGYTRLNQKREDTASGTPASLNDLLGDKGRKAVGVVAIVHPATQELVTYVPDKATEKYLESHGLVVVADAKPGKPTVTLEQLTKERVRKVARAEADAIDAALRTAIDEAPDRQVESLLSNTWLRTYHDVTCNHHGLDKATAERPALLRALLLDMLDELGPNAWDDAADAAIKQPAHEDLARATSLDLEAIRAAAEAEAVKDIDQQIAELQAKLKRKKSPPLTTPLAQPKALPGENKLKALAAAGATKKLKNPKLSPEQAQLGIAEAMQGIEGAPVPGPHPLPVNAWPFPVANKNTGALTAHMASAAGFAVGQQVRVTNTLRPLVARFAGKQGQITAADGDDWSVKLDGSSGRNGGTRTFRDNEIETVT